MSLILAILLSQTWVDPKVFQGPVLDYCRNYGVCTLFSLTLNPQSTPVAGASLFITSAPNSSAIVIPTATFINFFGAASTTGIRGTATGIGIEGTSLYVSSGNAPINLTPTGTSNSSTLPTTASVATGFAATNTTLRDMFVSQNNRWSQVGTALEPVNSRRQYVWGWNDNNPNWEGAVGQRFDFTGAIARTVACVGGTDTNSTASLQSATTFVRALTTGPVSGNDCATTWNIGANAFTQLLRWSAIVSTGPNTNAEYTFGINTDTTVFTNPSATPVSQGAWFRFSTVAGDTAFMACVADGTTNNCASTTVAIDTAAHVFEIDFRESGVVSFWVDGRVRNRVTSNIPGSVVTMFAGFGAETQTSVGRTIQTGRWSYEVR